MPIPTGISGSRAAAIIGLSQYSTPFTVWQELMESRRPGFNAERGYIYEPFEGNPATEFGKAFESAIIDLTEQATRDSIIDRELSYSLPDMEYVTCHIDGKFNGSGKMYEGKSCNHRAFYSSWGEPGTDRIPQSYQVQNQHSLMLTGLPSVTMGVLVFPKTVDEWVEAGWQAVTTENPYTRDQRYMLLRGEWTPDNQPTSPSEWAKVFAQIGNFHQYRIEAKPDTQKILKELYEEFWNKYILEETAPDCVDYADVRRCFTSPKGTLVIDEKDKIGGEPVADIMREYKAITKEVGSSGHLAKRKQFIKVQVLKFARQKTTVEDDESAERVLFLDSSGHKLGSFNKKGFRS